MRKKNKDREEYAIVTGASKGLGYNYCEEFLKKGFNVIGVARNCDSLHKLAEKYPNSKIEMINLDLSIIDNCYELEKKVKDKEITYFINNAGYGVWGFFDQTDIDQEMNMIDLNIKSLHVLTKIFVNRFKNQGFGRVFNIGSLVAAFVSAPVFSSYYASKAYVYSLGVAVNYELKKEKTNVRVITICPGLLKTDFWNRSSNQKDAKYKSSFKVIKTNVYANKSLTKAIKTKKDYVIVTFGHHLTKWFYTHMPKKLSLKVIYRYQKARK